MIRIVNLRNYSLAPEEILIKVDRSSVLGNPYHMHDESMRDKVCDKYAEYFNSTIDNPKSHQSFLKELNRIKLLAENNNIALGCWCYPKRCHAETILAWLKK